MRGSSPKNAETPALIPREEALALLDAALAGRRLPSESVPVRRAAGRTLFGAALSCLDLPPFDRAAVDGYALPAGDAREEFVVRETVAAGQVPSSPVREGEAVKIMTGAPVPQGTGEVVMLEDAEEEGGRVRVLRRGRRNFSSRGEDIRAGSPVLPAGRVLGPLDVANLVACGLTHAEVVRRPRLAVLSTGDEIVDDPAELAPGRIMDSNGPLLAGLADRYGLELVSHEKVPDELEPLRAALSRALGSADLVVLSGGVSVGEFDHVPKAFAELGLRLLFRRLRLKPGRPTTVAAAPGGQVVFGLPGNPMGVYLAFHLFVRRAAALLAGAPAPLRELSLPLGARFKRKAADREEFVPARLTPEGRIETLECHGSAHLLSLTLSDGFLVVPAGTRELEAGSPARFVPVPPQP